MGRGGTLLAIGLDDGSACVAAEFEIPNLEPPSHPETFGWYNEGNFIVEDRDVFFCQKFTRRDSSVVQVELETMTAKQVGPTDLGACRSIATYLDGAGLSWLGNDPAPSWAAYGEFLAWSSLESFANGDPPTREESPPELFYLQRSRIHRVDGDSGILYSLATSGTDHLERLDIAGTYERAALGPAGSCRPVSPGRLRHGLRFA